MSQGIFNLRRVDERLLSAGQPTEAELRELAGEGCRVVINLHMDDPRWALPGEAQIVRDLGMDYHHIPVRFDAPAEDDYGAFEQLMAQLGESPKLVHCVANYRVSCFLAVYGERCLGWSRERADAFIASVWEPDAVWQDFIARLRAL